MTDKQLNTLILGFHVRDEPGFIQQVRSSFDPDVLTMSLDLGHQLNMDVIRAQVTQVVHDFPTSDEPGCVWVYADVIDFPYEPNDVLHLLGYITAVSDTELDDGTGPCERASCSICAHLGVQS